MAIYKTPGVYVEEIPKFPPSIEAVETAIPAFIGYTEKATRNGQLLNLMPVAIGSMFEYEAIFGGAPAQDVEIYLDNAHAFLKASAVSGLYMYDSLRMFYANGGDKCYVVSVGSYPASKSNIVESEISMGLTALASEDEPTIILMPDAVSMSATDLSKLQQAALMQCEDLMDRVLLCDLLKAEDYTAFDNEVKRFRNDIGVNSLKYGAAYGPWINASLPRTILPRNLKLKREGVNTDVELESLTTDTGILNLIRDVKQAESAGDRLKASVASIAGLSKTLNDELQKALDGYEKTSSASTEASLQKELRKFTDLTFKALKAIQDVNAASRPSDTQFAVKKAINDYVLNPSLKDSILSLVSHHKHLLGFTTRIRTINLGSRPAGSNPNFTAAAVMLNFVDGPAMLAAAPALDAATAEAYAAAANHKARADITRNAVYAAAVNTVAMFSSIQSIVSEFEKGLNDALLTAFGTFKDLSTKAAEALNILPPSGAIAGVYASVDRDRGVWKAPANVSLNAVIRPALKVSHEQQAAYNVDVNMGKSINIIRTFSGKGTLIWGARTLAGNDNEWRYISVRRLFNFVEESIKKATEQFVFEPNDANTWVRLQVMIENFLITLWRQGALQGVKPEHAFYVSVGLGKTMTPLDILEGRLILEIGLAAVRPAEFIILKFSHKMVES